MKFEINCSVLPGNPVFDQCEIKQRKSGDFELITPQTRGIRVVAKNLCRLIADKFYTSNSPIDVVISGPAPFWVTGLIGVVMANARGAGKIKSFSLKDQNGNELLIPINFIHKELRFSGSSTTRR